MISTIIPPNARAREHTLQVPWDRERPELGTFELFARELYAEGEGESLPPLLFLQGGPGNPAPRFMQGWIPEALQHYRIFLMDERGTGRSGKIDRGTPELIDARILSKLRCPDVVADAEDLRRHLGFAKWDVLGNSFGALCTGSYLSWAPGGIGHAYLTGALPQLGWSPEVYNEVTLGLFHARIEDFYATVPNAQERVREICDHLNNVEEFLPTGERLTANRFRFVGVALGEEQGFHSLAILLEEPFDRRQADKRLRKDFLAMVNDFVSLERNPLWAVLHETLFGGPGQAPNWAAERTMAGRPGFRLDADPTNLDEPYYLLGNYFFKHHFDEDPALIPFREEVHKLAQKTDFSRVFNEEQLYVNEVPAVVALYEQDMYIPFEMACENAAKIGNMKVWSHPDWAHDAIYAHGAELFRGIYDAMHGEGASQG